MKYIISILLLLIITSCFTFRDNKISLDLKNKTITRDGADILNLSIETKKGSVIFSSKEGSNIFYLFKKNPMYDVQIYGEMCCGSINSFEFKPVANQLYTIEHWSNGDADSYRVDIMFDENNNLKIISK